MNPAFPTPDDPDPRCALCPRAAVFDRDGVYLCERCPIVVDGTPAPAPRPLDVAAVEASFWGWLLAAAALLLLGGLLLFSLPGWMAYP